MIEKPILNVESCSMLRCRTSGQIDSL